LQDDSSKMYAGFLYLILLFFQNKIGYSYHKYV
jgi:hypothetical protein